MKRYKSIDFYLQVISLLMIVATTVFKDLDRITDFIFDKDDKYGMPGLEILIWTTIPAILVSLFYTFITWKEWRNIKQRELTQFR